MNEKEMRIYKYKLGDYLDKSSVRLQMGAKILSVNKQNNEWFLWAMIDPYETKMEERVIRMAGTGHTLENVRSLEYLNTVLDGIYVWHFFEEKQRRT